MNIYIDCEFNSFGGDLISMALVPEDVLEPRFYEVIDTSHMEINPWVAKNVMPKLGQPGISLPAFQARLEAYLDKFQAAHIVADWPEDIAWLCRAIITGPGTRIRYPKRFTFQCVPIDTVSANPHNALADAEALADALRHKLP